MSVTLTYDATLSRVRITASDAFTAAYITIDRSTNGQQWTVVRGGLAVTPGGGSAKLDDYEFAPGLLTTYRARSYTALGVLLGTQTNTITATIDRVWLKSVTRPFLNTPVVVQDYSAVQRKSRATLFDIPGRSFPIRVADVSGSREWTTTVLTGTLTEQRAVEFIVASGDVVYMQVPTGYDIPGGYVGLGDLTIARRSRTLSDDRRLLSLPMTEVASPPATVIGFTSTWAGILADFGTWTAVLAAFPTWADVLQYVADPETVIVP